jgi:hypothetical protein
MTWTTSGLANAVLKAAFERSNCVDVPREGAARKRLIRGIALGATALIVLTAISIGLSRLKPAAPAAERATVWIDTVVMGRRP